MMLSAKEMTNSLSALPSEALAELGVLQARIQRVIESRLRPKRLYIGLFGHDSGHSIYLHFIPIYHWVEEALFWTDDKYRALQNLGSVDSALQQTDGAELTHFVWREFCERTDPPMIQGLSVDESIAILRIEFGSQYCD